MLKNPTVYFHCVFLWNASDKPLLHDCELFTTSPSDSFQPLFSVIWLNWNFFSLFLNQYNCLHWPNALLYMCQTCKIVIMFPCMFAHISNFSVIHIGLGVVSLVNCFPRLEKQLNNQSFTSVTLKVTSRKKKNSQKKMASNVNEILYMKLHRIF